MESIVRSRLFRIAVAGVLMGIGMWAFLPYVTFRVAPSAFVNAELVRVTAPFGGQLQKDLPRKGEFIPDARSINLVEVRIPDWRPVVALEQQRQLARTRADLALAQLTEISEADRALAARTEDHRNAMLTRLHYAVEEARAKRTACEAEEKERRRSRARVDSLTHSGAVSASQIDEAESAHRSTLARCQATDAQYLRLKVELDAAHKGIFLQDGYSDTPYSQQQRDRLMLRRQELEAEMLRERATTRRIEIDLEAERERIKELSRYDFTLPGGHIVWTTMASPGSAVIEGQAIVDLANCRDRFVVVELPERDLASVRAGDAAQIRFVGSDDWIVGRIQQVRGSAARSDERLLAAQVPRPNDRNVVVEVALPYNSLDGDPERFCDIGRLAEVWLGRRTLDPVGMLKRSWSRIVDALGFASLQVAARQTQNGR